MAVNKVFQFFLSSTLMIVVSGFAQKPGNDFKSLPYINPSVPEMETDNFHRSLQKIKKNLLWGDDSTALSTLSELKPSEQLATLYKHIIASDLQKKMGKLKASDSTLQLAQKICEQKDWQDYILLKRYRLYLLDSTLQNNPREFLTSLLDSKPEEVIKIKVLYKLIGLSFSEKHPEKFEGFLSDLLKLDHINPYLDTAYQKFFETMDYKDFSYATLIQAAKYSTNKSNLSESRKILEYLEGKYKEPSQKKELQFLLAENLYKQRQYSKAARAYSKYIDVYGNFPYGMLQLARSYTKSGNVKQGKKYYDSFTRQYPKHRKTEEIYWVRGFEAEQVNNKERAESYYKKLIPGFLDGNRGRWAYFRRGLNFYKNKDFNKAIEMFKKGAGQKTAGQEVAASLFWWGYVVFEKGLIDSATSIMAETIKTYPLNFYGHQAQAFLKKKGLWKSEFMRWVEFNYLEEDSLKKWMSGTFSKYQEFNKTKFESPYISIKDLLELGLDTMAIITLDVKYNSNRKNPWFSYYYARLFFPFWPGRAYRMALNIQYQIHSKRWGEVPLNVLRQIYPRPYREYVFKNAADKNLEENFIYALMRQESGFIEDIRSWAGAIGLMQIMPYTGKDLAKKAGLKNFQTFDLTKAPVNVFLGTNYLMDLKSDYNHDLMLVLANYNAGPGPARRWQREHSKKPVELFVEEVSYWETRDYIKKVMGNFWNYDLIYSDDIP